MAFVRQHEELGMCMYCQLPQYRAGQKPTNQFSYLPFLPQLKALYTGTTSAKAMRYRSLHKNDHSNCPDGTISDIYDSQLYWNMCKSNVISTTASFCTVSLTTPGMCS